MNVSAINELLNQKDVVTANTYPKIKTNLGKKSQKKPQIPFPLKTILNNALELIYTILIVASILGIYIASGLHEWWVQLVGHIT